MVTDSFQGCLFRNFLVELNFKLIEARRKAHNEPINTLSGLAHVREEIYELISTERLPSEPYDLTILSLLVRCLSIGHIGKTLTQHCSSLFPLF